MSQVLDQLGEITRRPDAEVLADLHEKGLARVLREESWASHGRAEFSDFEQALVKGTITSAAYRELMAQTYFIYKALEEVSATMIGDPVAGPFVIPELYRIPAIEADLAFYYGENWADAIKPLPVTEAYVERIKEAAATSPSRFVAHHYIRYLADLSGGAFIAKGITKAFALGEDGQRFYAFDELGDANEFKNKYRRMLDELPVSDDEKLAVIDETLLAYALNIELINVLSEVTAPFKADIEVIEAVEA